MISFDPAREASFFFVNKSLSKLRPLPSDSEQPVHVPYRGVFTGSLWVCLHQGNVFISYYFFYQSRAKKVIKGYKEPPGPIAQSDTCPTGNQEVAVSMLLFSPVPFFRWGWSWIFSTVRIRIRTRIANWWHINWHTFTRVNEWED